MFRTPCIFIMSASELVPFVATFINNGIAQELQRQNKEQKRKIEALESKIQDPNNERLLLLIQFTGRHGCSTYSKTSLKDGEPYFDGGSHDILWSLNFQDEDDAI